MSELFTMLVLLVMLIVSLATAYRLIISKKVTDSLICLVGLLLLIFMLMLYLNAEFLGISFLIIYVGAVAILFVFALMVSDKNEEQHGAEFSADMRASLLSLAFIFGLVFFEFVERQTYLALQNLYVVGYVDSTDWFTAIIGEIADYLVVSELLYDYYRLLFFANGIILLSAIVGVLALALPSHPFTKFISQKLDDWGGEPQDKSSGE